MKRAGRGKALKRAQQRKMKGLKEIPSARVVIFPEEEEGNALVIDSPKVFEMRVEGQSMYQVVGDATEIPVEEIGAIPTPEEDVAPTPMIELREEDIQLVAAGAGVSLEEAKNALEQNNGEPAKAIMALRSMG
ncbi:MAG: NAC domain-containing protein [Candidatus Hodarchaeales archaeon]|jgi:nascent polypeptide-associated complex subunit alpha